MGISGFQTTVHTHGQFGLTSLARMHVFQLSEEEESNLQPSRCAAAERNRCTAVTSELILQSVFCVLAMIQNLEKYNENSRLDR